jgi:pimeloyl-ACP methyl ester carboxylesterase
MKAHRFFRAIRIFFRTAGIVLFVSSLLVAAQVGIITSRPRYEARRAAEHKLFRAILKNQFAAQSVFFTTQDQVKLAGLLVVRPTATKNVIICHGYRMSKERMHRFALMLPHDNLLFFDYRAHGESGGRSSTIGYQEKFDVLAALDFVAAHEKTAHLPTVGIGVSMGAVTLLAAAAESQVCKAVVLDAPFARLDEQAKHMVTRRYNLPRLPFAYLVRSFFESFHRFKLREVDSVQCAQRLKIPTFMIHSQADQTVPFCDGQKIFEKLSGPKDMWVVSGSGHARIFTDHQDEYQKKINQFFSQHSL